MTADASTWQSLHLYYFEKRKDALFLDCLLPLRDALRERGADQLFFERHWRGGPHVRLRLRASDTAFRAVLLPVVESHVHAFLAAHPSHRRLDEDEARRQHEILAAAELDPEPFTPLAHDNTLEVVPYTPNLRFFRHDAMTAFVEDFSVAATPLLFSILQASRDDQAARLAIAVRLLLAHAHSMGDIETGYLFCRSYFEKYLGTATPDPDAARAKFHSAYDKRRETMRALVIDTARMLASSEPADPQIAQWLDLRRRFDLRVDRLLADGVPLAWGPDEGERQLDISIWRTKFWRHRTAYLDRLYANDALRSRMSADAAYKRHFVFVNQLYRLLSTAGVTGAEKFLLLALVAEGVEDVYGLSPLERIGTVARPEAL